MTSDERASPDAPETTPTSTAADLARASFRAGPYAIALIAVVAALGIARVLLPVAGMANIYLVFLTVVIGIAARYGFGPSLFGSLLSVVACNFFFLEPVYTLVIADATNAVTLFLFLVVALITSNLAALARAEAVAARRRADTTEALYSFSRQIAGIVTLDGLLRATMRQIASMLGLDVVLLLREEDGTLQLRESSQPADPIDAIDHDALEAAFLTVEDEGSAARSVLRRAERLFLPLRTSQGLVGVAGISGADRTPDLTPEQERLLRSLLDQAAVAIERIRLALERDKAQMAAETERLRSALLASLSHDLKTPLASITGAVTSLRAYAELYDAAARDELAATIQDEADRMTRFVTNLLDMARLEAGGIAFDRQPVDVGEAVGTALRRLGPVLAAHRVSVGFGPALPLLHLDAVLFEQVLVNLLDNAAKYAPAGSGIAIEGRCAGVGLILTIADEGPGIAPDDLAHVFEKFYRAERGDRRAAGTGLGLAIARGFVEALGGRIEAANRSDRSGAVFTLVFPQATFAAPRPEADE